MNENEVPSQPTIPNVESQVKKDVAPPPTQRKKKVLDALSQYWRHGKWLLAGSFLALNASRAAMQDSGPVDTSMNKVQPVVQPASQEYLNGLQDPEVFNIAIEHRLEQRGNDVVLVIENPYGEDVDFLQFDGLRDEKANIETISYQIQRVIVPGQNPRVRFIGKSSSHYYINFFKSGDGGLQAVETLNEDPIILDFDMVEEAYAGIKLNSNLVLSDSDITFDDENIVASLDGSTSQGRMKVTMELSSEDLADYLTPNSAGTDGRGIEFTLSSNGMPQLINDPEFPIKITSMSYTLDQDN